MKRRRDTIFIAEVVYNFLRKEKKEFSINKIAREVKAKWNTTARALEFLKRLDLVSERNGKKQPIAERLFKFKR